MQIPLIEQINAVANKRTTNLIITDKKTISTTKTPRHEENIVSIICALCLSAFVVICGFI